MHKARIRGVVVFANMFKKINQILGMHFHFTKRFYAMSRPSGDHVKGADRKTVFLISHSLH